MRKTCFLCRGGVTNGTITVAVELGFGVVVIRQAPASVCSQCGEEWPDDGVSQKIEEMVETAKQKHVSVEVAEWSHVAA